jgi:hypothetical protein
VSGIATLTPAGDLVLFTTDVMERGLKLDQLVNLLPLLGHLPIGAIIVKFGKRELKLTEAAIRSIRPAFNDEKLIRGIARVAEHAAELANRLAIIAGERSKEHADPSGQVASGDGALIRKLGIALAAGRPTLIKDFDVDFGRWLLHGRALAALSLTPLATDEEQRKARDIVRGVANDLGG